MKKQETVKIITGIVTVIKKGVVKVYSQKIKEDVNFNVPLNIKISGGFVPKFRIGINEFFNKFTPQEIQGYGG